MALWKSLSRLIQDPPPEHVFELSGAGVAYAHAGETGFEPLPAGALKISPAEDNVIRPETVAAALSRALPPNPGKKRRPAAILLPDAAARISVLDFDSFPDAPDEQISLVRFRLKKTIPFDIDSAAVSYYRQPGASLSKASGKADGKGKVEVVAVTVALEVLARYEALFRNAGYHPGEVTISALAALSLYRDAEPAVLAKLASNALTVVVVANGRLKLFRCLELEESSQEEIMSVLHPTFAYAEDELGTPVRKLILCGFDQPDQRWPAGAPWKIEPLRSRFGAANAHNAGLYGYLEGAAA